MNEEMTSNLLLAVIVMLIIFGLYPICVIVSILRASNKKKMTSHEPLLDNRTFAEDLKMEEKYVFSDPAKTRKPIARSDVSLWEQEINAKD